MSSTITAQRKIFGLLELDAEGTVIYSRIDSGDDLPGSAAEIKGRNFYREVALFKNIREFQQCLDDFRLGQEKAHTIGFTCQYDDGPVLVRVLLARIREYAEGAATKSILVHIRKAG